MASSQLYRDARRQFVQDAESRYRDSKDLDLLRDFLAQNSRPEDAQEAAVSLKHKAGEKWGSKKVGDVEIPALWIDRLMANIGNFVAVGNYAMTGAPESVGLAWFAVKLTLSAIQSNYELYSFFGGALTDISEIMIIIPHYDRLYDERKKTAKSDWKLSLVVEKLDSKKFRLEAFDPGYRAFDVAHDPFQGVQMSQRLILENGLTVFQYLLLICCEEEQKVHWALVLKNMEDFKATTKPKTSWDYAVQKFEQYKEILKPLENTTNALGLLPSFLQIWLCWLQEEESDPTTASVVVAIRPASRFGQSDLHA